MQRVAAAARLPACRRPGSSSRCRSPLFSPPSWPAPHRVPRPNWVVDLSDAGERPDRRRGRRQIEAGPVSDAGDVNGDGIGRRDRRRASSGQQRRTDSGSAYVVFGGASPTRSISRRSGRRVPDRRSSRRTTARPGGRGSRRLERGRFRGRDRGRHSCRRGHPTTRARPMLSSGKRRTTRSICPCSASEVRYRRSRRRGPRRRCRIGRGRRERRRDRGRDRRRAAAGHNGRLRRGLRRLRPAPRRRPSIWQRSAAGFQIDGAAAGDAARRSQCPVPGDVNGDLGGRRRGGIRGGNGDLAGAAYVVFGKTHTTPVDLATLGTRADSGSTGLRRWRPRR